MYSCEGGRSCLGAVLQLALTVVFRECGEYCGTQRVKLSLAVTVLTGLEKHQSWALGLIGPVSLTYGLVKANLCSPSLFVALGEFSRLSVIEQLCWHRVLCTLSA